MADANEEAAKICRECSSVNLRTDWAAGDLICTDCGIVNDENLRDSRAEWKVCDIFCFHICAWTCMCVPNLKYQLITSVLIHNFFF